MGDEIDAEALTLVLDIAMNGPPLWWNQDGHTCAGCGTHFYGGGKNRPADAHPTHCWWRRAVEIGHSLTAASSQVSS